MVVEQFRYVVMKYNKLTFPGNLYHHRDISLFGRGEAGKGGKEEGRLQHKRFRIK
jgi:hypothetical protein